MPIKFLVLGWGGSAEFIFMGARLFLSAIRDVAPRPYTPPPPSQGVTLFSAPPPSHFPLIRSRQGAMGGVAAGWWRVSRLLGSENGSRYRGVSQLQSHQSRCSMQLSHQYFLKSTAMQVGGVLNVFPFPWGPHLPELQQ